MRFHLKPTSKAAILVIDAAPSAYAKASFLNRLLEWTSGAYIYRADYFYEPTVKKIAWLIAKTPKVPVVIVDTPTYGGLLLGCDARILAAAGNRAIPIIKEGSDAFKSGELHRILGGMGVKRVAICGAFGQDCVLASATSALEKYEVIVSPQLVFSIDHETIDFYSRQTFFQTAGGVRSYLD